MAGAFWCSVLADQGPRLAERRAEREAYLQEWDAEWAVQKAAEAIERGQ